MIDDLKKFEKTIGPLAPSRRAYAVTPSDSETLPLLPRGLYIGTGGDVVVRPIEADADVTYKNLPDASYVAVQVLYVRATGTTASNIIAEA